MGLHHETIEFAYFFQPIRKARPRAGRGLPRLPRLSFRSLPSTPAAKAEHFLQHERAFRLGMLPTEQPHPATVGLAETLTQNTAAGLAMLLGVDRDVAPVAERVLGSAAYASLTASLTRALTAGGRVYFTGCGATGRLAILLEASWRRHWMGVAQRADSADRKQEFDQVADQVRSVMAGGDFALIRSVEGFEDFDAFGRHQLREAGVAAGDVVVAMTEGGETSFVIGTAWQALEADAESYLVFNNPADVLTQHVERSRRVIQDPRITKLDLTTGPMAVAGSTRMQATTIELLVLGTALEAAASAVGRSRGVAGEEADPAGAQPVAADAAAERFTQLLQEIGDPDNLSVMAALTEREAALYRAGGLVTYFADAYLLDIMTDTTERSPTFSLPPFRPEGDTRSARSWSFVKDPRHVTPQAWANMLGRPPWGLDWDQEKYAAMNAPEAVKNVPPDLSRSRILQV